MGKILDLFCGCGGFSTGFIQAGHKVMWGIDNDKRVQKTYEYNHPDTEFILSDIRDLDPNDFKNVDIVIGSPPCPNFSLANNKRDPKKGMVLVNKFRKWIETIKPKWWIMENVPPIYKYLDDFYPIKRIINCADYGVPQIRKRCFSGLYIFPRPMYAKFPYYTLDGKKTHRWITVKEAIGDLLNLKVEVPNHIETKSSQESMIRKLSSNFGMQKRYKNFSLEPRKYQLGKAFMKKHPPLCYEKPASCVTTKDDKHIIETSEKKYRRLTVRECARLQSFPDEFIFFGSLSAQYMMIGNAIPPLMAYHFGIYLK